MTWEFKNFLLLLLSLAAFRPTNIGNLAFAHKGFTFNSFSIVFSVLTFQGIVFLESLRKRWFPPVQLWQIKQWKACNLSKTAVIKTETFCRRVRLRQILQILQRIEKTELKTCKNFNKSKMSFFLFVLVPLFDLKCQKRGFLCSKWHFKCQQNVNTLVSLGIWQTEQ